MKNIWLLIAVIAVLSCKNEPPIDYAIVTGSIANSSSEELRLMSTDRSVIKTLTLAADGTFRDTIREKPNSYIIYEGRNRLPLYVNHGDNINLNYDAEDMNNSLIYSGNGFEASSYLFTKQAKTAEMMGERNTTYELEEPVYKAKMNEIKLAIEELLTDSEGLSETFKAKEKKNIYYNYLGALNIHASYYSYYAKKPDFKASGDFLQEMDDFDYNNEEDYLFSSSYKDLVSRLYTNKARELIESDSLSYGMAFLEILKEIPNEMIKNDLLFSSAKGSIKYADDLDAYFDEFNSISSNEENKKEILEIYNKVKKVSAGQPSPKFVNYENHAGGTTSLDDLKGKYVYIDVWATWCGPCKAEIPFLKKVEEKYHGKNIHFVSISIDAAKDYDKWVKMVNDEELGGIQLLGENDWNSKFVQDYLINGIPHFILIDPNGTIVKYSAPRPSNSKLIDLFNELNI